MFRCYGCRRLCSCRLSGTTDRPRPRRLLLRGSDACRRSYKDIKIRQDIAAILRRRCSLPRSCEVFLLPRVAAARLPATFLCHTSEHNKR